MAVANNSPVVENAAQAQTRRAVDNMKVKRRKIVIIAVNEQGYRIGSSHHNATISDEIVDKMRDLHEDSGIGYRRLAKMFNLSRSVVAKLCKYERRAQTPERWKKVVKDEIED